MISTLLVNESNDSHLELTNAPFVILVKLNEPCYMSILPKKLFKQSIPNYDRMCCDCNMFDTEETKITNKKPIRKEESLKEEELIVPTVK